MKIRYLLPFLLFLTLATVAQNVPEVLRPPKGSQVAMVVFEDLQCPQCGRVAPVLDQAARSSGVSPEEARICRPSTFPLGTM